MKLDGTDPTDMTPIVTYVISLIKNMTNAEQEKIYWEKNPQRQCDSSNNELSQGTKSSEQTPGNSTASPVVQNSETKTLNDTHVTTHTPYVYRDECFSFCLVTLF